MGNADSKITYRRAVMDLTTRGERIDFNDDEFWSQFWHDNHLESMSDVFTLLSAQEIRQMRDESPQNLATLCFKATEQLVQVTDTLCNTANQHKTVITCVSLLTRIIPYLFEDAGWRKFFWSNLCYHPYRSAASDGKPKPTWRDILRSGHDGNIDEEAFAEFMNRMPLAQSLMLAISDLLFCPDFTVSPLDVSGGKYGAPDTPPEDLQSIDSCEYIWEAGVGCSIPSEMSPVYHQNRTDLLRLLLTCFSESMYCTASEVGEKPNRWIEYFTSSANRHALPLFTSLLNTVFAYNPNPSFLPFNHLLFTDSKEPLVEVALQILIVTLDHDFSSSTSISSDTSKTKANSTESLEQNTADSTPFGMATHKLLGTEEITGASISLSQKDNLFINYISRIHREEDFEFILKGFTRLLNNPLQQSYLPNSTKRVGFHQELLVLFWKICDYNKMFMYYVLKTCDVLKILVPILYHLNDARSDRSRVGLVHIGVFIILLLSGERNFGVRLNRPYQATVPMDLPIFSGTHADLLVIVFHKLITTGHQRLQPLFDCLLTILVNVSPYLKTLSMVASAKILHLLEAFSTPWFLFSNPTNHHLVFFLLEIFNNIIQYQFDGNSNLMYTIIRKRHIFQGLANLPTDYGSIERSLKSPPGRGITTSVSMTSLRNSNQKKKGGQRLSRGQSMVQKSSSSKSYSRVGNVSNNSSSDSGERESTDIHQYPHSAVLMSKSTPMTPSEQESSSSVFDSVIKPTDLSKIQLQDVTKSDENSNAIQSLMLDDEAPSSINMSKVSIQNHAPEQKMNVTLAELPKLDSMTEKTHANSSKHLLPSQNLFEEPDYEYQSQVVVSNKKSLQNEMYTETKAIVTNESTTNNSDNDDQNETRTIPKLPVGGEKSKVKAKNQQTDSDLYETNSSHSDTSDPDLDNGENKMNNSFSQQHKQKKQHTTNRKKNEIANVPWSPTSEWIVSWKQKMPLQTIMRMLQVLVPQVEKMCIDKGITDENEILKFLQHGTLVGLLPVPHPILIRKYQTNIGTTIWFRTYMWGIIYLRNCDPPIWYDTNVKLFEIQKN